MNLDDDYDISKEIEDKYLYSVAVMAKDVLKDKYIITNMIQKHVVAYNTTSKTGCSSKSLKVMNQSHKPIFETFKSPEVMESIHCSSVSAEKDAKASKILDKQSCTPLKTNQINSNTERKRLSFDIEETECKKPVQESTENIKEGQNQLNSNASFLQQNDEAKNYENPQEILNCNGITKSSSFFPSRKQLPANLSKKTPEELNEMLEIFIGALEWKPWYLECRQSFLRGGFAPNEFGSSNEYVVERFNIEGKPETITGEEICDDTNDNLQTKSTDEHQIDATSPEKENSSSSNYVTDGRKSAVSLSNTLSIFSSKQENEISSKIEQKSLNPDEKLETVFKSPVTPINTLCLPSKTPEKAQTCTVKAKNKARKSINPNVVRKVADKTDINKENVSPIKDKKVSNSPKIKKRKLVHYSEKIKSTCLATADQEFIVPTKISKISDELGTDSKNTSISSVSTGNDSIYSTDESLIDVSSSFHSADDSIMHDSDGMNLPEDEIVEKGISESSDKSTMSAVLINKSENLCVSPAKTHTTPKPICQTSIPQVSASFVTPEVHQNNIAAEVVSDFRSSKHDEKDISVHEAKEFESLINLMEYLNPLGKKSGVKPVRKSLTNESEGDNETVLRKLPLQDNISNNISPKLDSIISKEQHIKHDSSYYFQVKKFNNMLKQSKTRFSVYLHTFQEDKDDLNFIYGYTETLATVIRKLPPDNNEELVKSIDDSIQKCMKIMFKATSWVIDVKRNIVVWKDCIKKIDQIEQYIKVCGNEKKHIMTSEHFQVLETVYKIVKRKADDMILLREVRRPTLIHFEYEILLLIQLVIQIMVLVGLFKHSLKYPSK